MTNLSAVDHKEVQRIKDVGMISKAAKMRSSWATAAKIAWLDVRQHKVMTLLSVLILVVPATWLIVGIGLGTMTTSVDSMNRATFGAASATVQYYPSTNKSEQASSVEIPNLSSDASVKDATAALTAHTGWDLVAWVPQHMTIAGEKAGTFVAVSKWVDFGPKVQVMSGRLPQTPQEILVTPLGRANGLPESGTFTSSSLADGQELTVVGVARVLSGTNPADAIGLVTDEVVKDHRMSWLVMNPVTDVTQASAFQHTDLLVALKDSSVLHATDDSPSFAFDLGDVAHNMLFILFFFALQVLPGLLICGALLSPAFTVGARRIEHSLRLLWLGGAPPAVLRRVVTMQAVALGAIACLISTGLGITFLAIEVKTGMAQGKYPNAYWPPLLPALGLVLLACMVVAIASAQIPAWRVAAAGPAGIASAHARYCGPRRVFLWCGLSLGALITGTCVVAYAFSLPENRTVMVPALAMIGLAICLVGLLLTGPGWLGATERFVRHRSPLTKLASLETTRNRGRSTAVFTCMVLTSVLLSSYVVTSSLSDLNHRVNHSGFEIQPGELFHFANMPTATPLIEPAAQAIQQAGYSTQLLHSVVEPSFENKPTLPPESTLAIVHAGHCTDPAQLFADQPQRDVIRQCQVSGFAHGSGLPVLVFAPADYLVDRFHLTPQQRQKLLAGTVLTQTPEYTDHGIKVSFGTISNTTQQPEYQQAKTIDLPTEYFPPQKNPQEWSHGFVNFMALESAQQHQIPMVPMGYQIFPQRFRVLTTADRAKIWQSVVATHSAKASTLHLPSALLSIGHVHPTLNGRSDFFRWLAIATGIITLMALLLLLLVQRSNPATRQVLAALGAPTGANRWFVFRQGASLIGSACGLGTLLGVLICAAISPATMAPGPSLSILPMLVVPLLSLLICVTSIPLIAAGIAAVAITPPAPVNSRRSS